MLYALENGLKSIVAAADELMEFEEFVKNTANEGTSAESIGVKLIEMVSFVDLLSDEIYQGFKLCPVLVFHIDEEHKAAFNSRFRVSSLKLNALVKQQRSMLVTAKESPYANSSIDARSIEEIHGLIDNDRWDTRSEEQKAVDQARKEQWDDAKRDDRLSGDSFGPSRKRTDAAGNTNETSVTDIKVHKDKDGQMKINDVLAVKGLHDRASPEVNKARHDPANPSQATLETAHNAQVAREKVWRIKDEFRQSIPQDETDTDDLEVDIAGRVAIYYKVEVETAKLQDIWPILDAAKIDIRKTAARQRNSPTGCWFAFPRQIQAEDAAKVLEAANLVVEVYGVNDAGIRLVPKGVKLVDELKKDEIHPRPWNWRASEIDRMTPEEQEENRKTLKATEFCFCGGEEGVARVVQIHITPLSYFKEHGKMWEHKLDIGDILPPDLEEVSPGVYQSIGRNWLHLCFDLNQRGFRENMFLQIYLNSQ